MGVRWSAVATVAALLLGVCACDGSAERAEPSPELTPTRTTGYLRGAPEDGTCWRVPADMALSSTYWYDDSPQVPCDKPHTTETTAVMRLTDPTIAEAKKLAGACWNNVRVHLGVDPSHWIPWGVAMFLPTRDQIRDGADWVRCDAVFPDRWDFKTARTTTITSAGVAAEPPDELWACLDRAPANLDQAFVPCERPHRYEQTGTLASLEGLQRYPRPAKLEAAARVQCSRGTPGDDGDGSTDVTALWDAPAALENETSLFGVCFMFHETGNLLPPRS